ncbi:MAG TPA: hypothetical protein VL854_12550 [Nitrososphaeraceae archaeon]|nr:hypothetical protein [Nitrososphaeraceae archaeon]
MTLFATVKYFCGTNLIGIIPVIYEKFAIEDVEIELSNLTAREKTIPFSL